MIEPPGRGKRGDVSGIPACPHQIPSHPAQTQGSQILHGRHAIQFHESEVNRSPTGTHRFADVSDVDVIPATRLQNRRRTPGDPPPGRRIFRRERLAQRREKTVEHSALDFRPQRRIGKIPGVLNESAQRRGKQLARTIRTRFVFKRHQPGEARSGITVPQDRCAPFDILPPHGQRKNRDRTQKRKVQSMSGILHKQVVSEDTVSAELQGNLRGPGHTQNHGVRRNGPAYSGPATVVCERELRSCRVDNVQRSAIAARSQLGRFQIPKGRKLAKFFVALRSGTNRQPGGKKAGLGLGLPAGLHLFL